MADLGSDGDHQGVFAKMMAQRRVKVAGGDDATDTARPQKPSAEAFERRKEMARSRPRPNDGRYKPKLHGPRDQQLNTTISETSKLQLVDLKNITRKSIADLIEEMIDAMHQAETGKRS